MNSRMRLSVAVNVFIILLYLSRFLCVCPDSVSPPAV
jgi:hypothetical protein